MSDYLAAIPLSDVKSFLNITDTVASRDAWLEREVLAQFEGVERYLDRPVVVQQFRDDIDGTGYDSLDLVFTPVQSVIDVRIDADRKFGISTRIDSDTYIVDDDSVEIMFDGFPQGRRNVRVQYIAGYAEIEIPFARRRFDIREVDGGDVLTVYLPTGTWKPTVLAESLESALNDIGDTERSVSFDWTQRQFVIEQTDGDYLQVVTSISNDFTTSESATGILGYASDATRTDDKIVSDPVALGIPNLISSTILELVAIHFSQSSFGQDHYGVASYQLDDYRVTYEADATNGSEQESGIPARLEKRLRPFKKWDLI